MSEAQWYVVHTYSGYENKVKVDIEKTIENRGLQDQILEVSVPLEEVIELKNGAQKQVERKMFPGYVLIHMLTSTFGRNQYNTITSLGTIDGCRSGILQYLHTLDIIRVDRA